MSHVRPWRAKGTGSYRATILVPVYRRASNRPLDSPQQPSKRSRGGASALIEVAVIVPAKLRALRCIDTPEPDASAVDLDRITVDHAGLSDQVIPVGWKSGQTGHSQREPKNSIYFDFQGDYSPLQMQANRESGGKTILSLWGG